MGLLGAGVVGVPASVSSATSQDPEFSQQVLRWANQVTKGEPKTLSLLLPSGSRANLDPVIKAFAAGTGTSFDLTEVPPDDISATLLLHRLSGNKGFDLALPASFAVPDLVAAEALRPIDQYVEKYEPAGFRDGMLYQDGDHVEGTTFGFQTDGDAYMLFYNRRMFEDPARRALYEDQFGVSLEIPQTWDELDRQMEFFHAPEENQYGGLLFRNPEYVAWEWWARLHAKGIWPFAPDMTPQFDSAAGEESLEDMMAATSHLWPGTERLGLVENWARYAQGDVYANFGWGGSQKFFNAQSSQIRGQLLFGQIPGPDLNGTPVAAPYFNWGWNYVISTGSQMPELAYLFALFASCPDLSTLAVRQSEGFFDPFRSAHFEDEKIIEVYSPEFLKVQRASLETAMPDLYMQGHSAYFSALSRAILQALDGQLRPRQALLRAARMCELTTMKIGRDDQSRQWANLRGRYPERLAAALRDL